VALLLAVPVALRLREAATLRVTLLVAVRRAEAEREGLREALTLRLGEPGRQASASSTLAAGAIVALPACSAVTMQVPAAAQVTFLGPLMVQLGALAL